MEIKQFEDKSLSHYSYAVLSDNRQEMILVDPSRNIEPYLEFAGMRQAKIIAVVETHPHADFISGHLELHEKTGATIYCSKLTGAQYPHQSFDEGEVFEFGDLKLKAINTPGHSPDSISLILEQGGKDKAVFTGDTLFIGDCGRPDLRESVGNTKSKREDMARQMYHSLRKQLMTLADEVLVYPAHGAGTLCGKSLSDANSSTIGDEKISNWCLQPMTEDQFVKRLTFDPPFVPLYFPFDVELNRKGALAVASAISHIKMRVLYEQQQLGPEIMVIDTRPAAEFKMAHRKGAFNIMAEGKFETWLGSIIKPAEPFYLIAANEQTLKDLVLRTTKIGYESMIKEGLVCNGGEVNSEQLNVADFKENASAFTILDVRNSSEVKENPGFEEAIHIPLPELRARMAELPLSKPIMVHCAGGYRSAAASSILESKLPDQTKVYDLSTAVKEFF
jgi:hydroxyacylglutathione hydrolase